MLVRLPWVRFFSETAAQNLRQDVLQDVPEGANEVVWGAVGDEGRVQIESEWTARKREREAGRLCPAAELPHSSQNRA